MRSLPFVIPSLARRLATLTLSLGLVSPAMATPLFQPSGAAMARSALPSWARGVEANSAEVRRRAASSAPFLLESLPLADGRSADFLVEPVPVFAEGARVLEFDGKEEREIGLPAVAVFEGPSTMDPQRRVILSLTEAGEAWAIVRDGNRASTLIHPLGGKQGEHAVVDPSRAPARTQPICEGSPSAAGGSSAKSTSGSEPSSAYSPGTASLPATTRQIEVLVDLEYELFAGPLGSDSARASAYAAGVMGAVSAIYRRDLNIVTPIKQLVVWTAADPFTGNNTSAQLTSYRSWNDSNRPGVSRDLTHLLGGLPNSGGIAYLDTLCDNSYGYGVSNLDGDSSLFPTTGYLWDVNVVAHELGHNFGSGHTHCYEPPIDTCYNQESGCWSGAVTASKGETMSYCHLTTGGVEMGFGERVGNVVRFGADTASCADTIITTCGNGTVEAGEQCDDGNTAAGDCCSEGCTFEPRTVVCADDGSPCTTDVCDGAGACSHVPPGSCGSCDEDAIETIPAAGGTVSGFTSGTGTQEGPCVMLSLAAPERIFRWTPSASGEATADTCNSGFDTVLYVRQGTCASGGSVACNDDATEGCTGGNRSHVRFPVQAGTTYYIVVDGYYTTSGSFELRVDLPPPGDVVVAPLAAKTFNIKAGSTELAPRLGVTVRNAAPVSQTVQLEVTSDDCPAGSWDLPDFRPKQEGYQTEVTLAPGKTAKADVQLRLKAEDFTSYNFRAPARCRLNFRASSVGTGVSDDPAPTNNEYEYELNVIDRNDAERTTADAHESLVVSAAPKRVKIAKGKEAAASSVSVTLGNADYRPAAEVPGDTIQLVPSGTCPGVTLGTPVCSVVNKVGFDSGVVKGGATRKCKVPLSATAAEVSGTKATSPARCQFSLLAVGPSAPETAPRDASNNLTVLTVDVIDTND